MANFTSMRLTAAGFRLRAAAEIGQRLEITRVGLGAGIAPDDIADLTALVDERQSVEVEAFQSNDDGTGLVRFYLSNADLVEGYSLREIGVYALDPDSGDELLIDYTNAGDSYDTIPAGGGATVVEQTIDLITAISPTDNISAQLTSHRSVPPGGEPGDVLMISSAGVVVWGGESGRCDCKNDDTLIALIALAASDIENKATIVRQEQHMITLDRQLQQHTAT